ncbi:MAG: hypothetical protein GY892_10740, partial [Shimia sp.]|nr:hypothetical protein [Shimia sp.]
GVRFVCEWVLEVKNHVIDVVQRLAAHAEPVARWKAATEISENLGFSLILVAQVDAADRGIQWVNTSMSMDWMEEYLCEHYIGIDPLFEGVFQASRLVTMQTGLMTRTQAETQKAYALNHGLKAAGMDVFACSRFGNSGTLGTHVSLVGSHSLEQMIGACPIDLALYSGLLAAAITAPVPSRANDRLKPNPDALTVRQREVLSLLAEGMMTARIAETLGISEAAVNKHFIAARQKLDAATREQAMAKALLQGLISL